MTSIPDPDHKGDSTADTDGSTVSLEVPVDDSFIRVGRRGWAFVGIVAASVILYVVLAALSGLVIPLVVAAVIGTLFVPVVDKLENHMSRKLASGLVLVGLVVVGVGAVVVAIAGVADQASEIRSATLQAAARNAGPSSGPDAPSVDASTRQVADSDR